VILITYTFKRCLPGLLEHMPDVENQTYLFSIGIRKGVPNSVVWTQ